MALKFKQNPVTKMWDSYRVDNTPKKEPPVETGGEAEEIPVNTGSAANEKELEDMTEAELRGYAKSHNIDVSKIRSKAKIIEKLKGNTEIEPEV